MRNQPVIEDGPKSLKLRDPVDLAVASGEVKVVRRLGHGDVRDA